MKKVSTQQGFAVLEVILIIVILAILGFTGWYVMHSKQQTDATLTKSTTTQTAPLTRVGKSSDGVLTIKQWKVKMTVGSELGTVNYTYEPSTNAMKLSSDLQKTLPSSCSYAKNSPWEVSRTQAAKEDASDKTADILVDGYYYHLAYPQTGCENAATVMSALDGNYHTMFSTLKAE